LYIETSISIVLYIQLLKRSTSRTTRIIARISITPKPFTDILRTVNTRNGHAPSLRTANRPQQPANRPQRPVTMSTPTQIILNGMKDWDDWIEVNRTTALASDIWDLINPDELKANIPQLTQPTRPEPSDVKPPEVGQLPTAYSMLSTDEKEQLRLLQSDYTYDRKEYDRKRKALADIRIRVVETIKRDYVSYTHKCATVHDMLVKLKDRIAPTDKIRERQLIEQYKSACKPPKSQGIEQWVQKWEKTYDDCSAFNIPEVQGSRPLFDFIQAISGVSTGFADVWNVRLIESDNHDLQELVKQYRLYLRTTQTQAKSRGDHGAFPTTLQGKDTNGKPKCLCQDYHFYSECPYLIVSKRPKVWKADESIQKKIENDLKSNSVLQKRVESARKRATDSKDSKPSSVTSEKPSVKPSTDKDDDDPSAFTVLIPANYFSVDIDQSTTSYALQNSFILDSGATIHCCNTRKRFHTLTPAAVDDILYAGSEQVQIEAYGDVYINVEGINGSKRILLQRVAYVPSFHTSVASLRQFIKKNVHWDTQKNRLVYKDKTFCHTPVRHGQWVLEYNPLPSAFPAHKSRKPRPTSKATADLWHKRLGHLREEAIQHLPTAARDVEIVPRDRYYVPPCQTCRLSSAKQIISRVPTDRRLEPFARVHLDLIQMRPAMDDSEYIQHFFDECTHMNFVYTKESKRTSLATTQDFCAMTERQYNLPVKILRLDGETSLLTKLEKWAAKKGIIIERSPPHTQDQNGAAERSGGVLIARSTSLRIEANFPEELWPEIYQTAGYLINRSPTAQLNWMTPLEKLQTFLGIKNPKPKLNHTRAYGCKAYALIKNRPRLDKINPKAFIGYLVGYNSTNIYRIWQPTRDRVISTRDVTFDESEKYNQSAKEIDPLDEIVETIQVPDSNKSYYESSTEDEELELQFTDEEYDTIPVSDRNNHLETRKTPENWLTDSSGEPATRTPSTDSSHTMEGQLITPRPTPSRHAQPTTSVAPFTDRNPDNQPVNLLPRPETPQNRETSLETSLEALQGRRGPRGPRTEGIDESNIIKSSRTRKPRRDAYLADLSQIDQASGFHSAFQTGTQYHRDNQRLHRTDLPPLPRTWKDLDTHSYGPEFQAAARKEYNDLDRRGTFQTVPITEATGHFIIPVMWVFTYKFDTDGYLIKFKARLVVRGDLQPTSRQDTYAATLAARVFRCLIAIAAQFDLDTHQLDAVNAFTNSDLDEEVYIRFPEGFGNVGFCIRLLRALYGLRRSPLLWFTEFSSTLLKLGLRPVPEAECLYINNKLIVFFFVDDIAILNRSSDTDAYDSFRTRLLEHYEMRDIGELKWFLGIRVIRDRLLRKVWLCQDSYIDKIAHTFHLTDGKAPPTPMATDELLPYSGQASPQEIYGYQRKIGSLTYATVITRVDVSRTANKLAEFLQNPSPAHHAAADRAIRYLYHHKNLALEYGSTDDTLRAFTCASDAAFSDDLVTRQSTEGFLFQLFGGPIDWKSTKQKTVTTSSTEAELMALSHAAKDLYWWRRFFKNLTVQFEHEFHIQCDNQQTIRLMDMSAPKLVTKLKHIDIHQHWLRQEVQEEQLRIEWIPTSEMPADGLTKALPRQKHEAFVRQLRLVDITTLLSILT